MRATTCEACPVSLICLMGKLDIRLYCAICEKLWLMDGRAIDCDFANKPGVMLSVCTKCQQAARDKRKARVQKCLRRRHGTTDQSRRD